MVRIKIQNSDSLDLYLRDIAASKPLSAEEEIELSQQIHRGDQRARDRLVAANLRFVVSVAREYQHYGVPLADLISAGNMGLMVASERFDGARGFKFISYAVWWIRQAIQQSLAEDFRTIRLPVNRIDLLHDISRVSREWQQLRESEPDMEVIAEQLGVSVEMVRDTLLRSRDVGSLDSTFGEDEECSLLHILHDSSQGSPDSDVIQASVRDQVEKVLDTLDKREAQVLRLYFGLSDERPLTLEEIGARFNLTRERVRQIKEKALKRLRHPQRRGKLNPLLESA